MEYYCLRFISPLLYKNISFLGEYYILFWSEALLNTNKPRDLLRKNLIETSVKAVLTDIPEQVLSYSASRNRK